MQNAEVRVREALIKDVMGMNAHICAITEDMNGGGYGERRVGQANQLGGCLFL